MATGFSALARRDHAVVRPVAVPDVISGDGYITYMSTGYQAICPQVFRVCPLFNPIMSAIYTQSCPLFITPSGHCPLFTSQYVPAIYHASCPLFITPLYVSCLSPICPLFTTPTHVSTVQEGRLPAIHPAKTNYRLQAHYKLITSCWPCNTTAGALQGLRNALRACVLRYEARYEARNALRILCS